MLLSIQSKVRVAADCPCVKHLGALSFQFSDAQVCDVGRSDPSHNESVLTIFAV